MHVPTSMNLIARRSLTIATAIVLLAMAGTAPAQAAAIVLVRGATTPLMTDGHGLIVFMSSPGTVHVVDESAGTSFDADVSGGCLAPPAEIVGVGGGQVLYECQVMRTTPNGTFPHDVPRLLDVATRSVQEPPGAEQLIDDATAAPLGSAYALAVGAHGLLFATPSYHAGESTEILDWHAGTTLAGPSGASQVLDLDSPTGATALCAPLQRMPYDSPLTFDTPAFDPYQYEPPYGVLDGPHTGLALERCGSDAKLLLQPWRHRKPRALKIQLASGVVSWVVGDAKRATLYAYRPSCGIRLSWPTEPFVRTGHLTNALVVNEATSADGPWTARRVSIAGACQRSVGALALSLRPGTGSDVAAALRSGSSVQDVPSGGLATVVDGAPQAIPRVRARAGSDFTLVPAIAARSVRWRLGVGAWRRAVGAGREWSLRVPRSHVPHTLTIELGYARGGTGRFAVRVGRTAR
jgi:hypothetical protein